MRSGFGLFLFATSAFILCQPVVAAASDQDVPAAALNNLSLEQLSNLEVTSVSKKAEKASQAAAAIYIITQDDIHRSGMQSIPDLLRMVPGLQVAQSGSQNWDVSSRGFNGEFSNKLLVMIDGRSVYTPVFSGVFWDVQNVLLEDIDRIEVIRGPGATLWGANAVNGVINIITKSAKDTQGTLISAAAGNQDRVSTAGRFGGNEGDLYYRSYAQYFNDNQLHTAGNPAAGIAPGTGAEDQWHNAQGGFRLDWGKTDNETTTLQGDVYQGQENALRFLPVTPAISPGLINIADTTDNTSGMNLVGRWKHQISTGSDVTLQAYYDDAIREFEYVGSSLHTQTFDIDFQHNLTLGSRNELTWGLGYRAINSDFGNGFYISYQPEDYNENLFSGFLQDKLALVQDTLYLTFGTKLEHNDFSGFEWEPSVRLAWTPTENQTLWAAISRAVRSANQSDQDLHLVLAALPSPTPAILAEQGLQSAESDIVDSYEVGYRIRPQSNLSFDVTAFVNEYKQLDSSMSGNPYLASDPTMGSYLNYPLYNTNTDYGETHGIELATTWKPMSRIKISGGYSVFYETLHIAGSGPVTNNGTAPQQQFNARSFVDLPHDVEWDTMLYYVDRVPSVSDGFGGQEAIPAYLRLDMRLGWKPTPGLDLSLIGQNLLQSEHIEYSPFLYQTTEEIGRSVLAKATLKF
jgi:iron complex outermembrane receptor protein